MVNICILIASLLANKEWQLIQLNKLISNWYVNHLQTAEKDFYQILKKELVCVHWCLVMFNYQDNLVCFEKLL